MKPTTNIIGRNSTPFRIMTALLLLIIATATLSNQSIFAAAGKGTCKPEHAKSGNSSDGCVPADLQEVTDQLDPRNVKPLLGQSTGEGDRGEVGAEAISYPDYTYRHNWGYRRGQLKLTLYSNGIHAYSKVLVSASELDPNGRPMLGAARYTVHNVAPFEGGVTVWINIEWGASLRTQLSYLVLNS